MSLALESRHCGSVYVVRCTGRIVSGEESAVLTEALQSGLREFTRVVLQVGEVTRVDSAGMGLIVRFLWHARNRNGDLRLAAPQLFLTDLLNITKLSTVFRIYPDEEAAIVSFLKEGAIAPADSSNTGPRVLFLDEPTIGLDLLSQRTIRGLVRTLNQRYCTTVMLTSHYLSDIEDLCERVILINRGTIVYDGALAGVNATLAERKMVKLVFSAPVAQEVLARYDGYQKLDGLTASFEVERSAVRAFSRTVLDELPVIDLTIEEIPLEEGIAALYRGEPPGG